MNSADNRAEWSHVGENCSTAFDRNEAVVLDLQAGRYYGLNESGTFLWTKLLENHSRNEVIALYCARYGVSPEVGRTDLDDLLADLQSRGLLKLHA